MRYKIELAVCRVIDMPVSLVVLPFTLVVTALVWLIYALGGDPKPPWYHSIRLGRNCRKFRMWKIRTEGHPALGNLLRATRLDELPQVVNVILLQMSWVGCRAVDVGHDEVFIAAGLGHRFDRVPGVLPYSRLHRGSDEAINGFAVNPVEAQVEPDRAQLNASPLRAYVMAWLLLPMAMARMTGAR